MSKENKFLKDMTKGTPWKLLLQFAVPLFIGNIFQQLYNMVDSIIVGNFVGPNALGAIGTTNSLNFLFFSLVAGLSVGIGIIVAQFFGSNNEEKVKDTIGNAIWIVLISSVIMACIGFFVAKPVLVLLRTDKVILGDATAYLKVTSIGICCTGLYNGVSSILRALGDSKTPLIFLISASLVNVVLDLWFVLGLGWGVVGAGVATAFSQFLSAVTCIFYAYKSNTYFRLKKKNFKLNSYIVEKSLRLGIPVALQNSLIAFSLIVLQAIVNGYGATFTTAFTVISRIETLVQQPFMSLGAAVSTYTGQNLGAGKTDRVVKGFNSSNVMNGIFSAVVLVLFWTFTSPIVSIFGKDVEVLRIASDGLRITSCFYVFLGLIYTTRNVLNGAGDAMFSLFTGIVECIGRVGFAYPLTLIPFLGSYGVFVATGITWMLNGLFSLIRYKRGKWKTINLVVHNE
ncbi:MATE family efflux transporter [uncultured Eubacterium sp.]|jgi:putative MATE family efflux protein|uniref:MATE family efflux transporter n=2 Tax=Eubacterium TaxID=1730 RepID=UPI0025E37832|nr:MATE family efflux transporter [uncultured Eubacterium sp.]